MLSVQYASMLEYRAEMFLWVVSGSLPLILAGVWAEAAGSGKLAMSPADYARYFFCTFVVRQMTLVWVVWAFEEQVVQGTLSFRLLQPIDPGWHHVSEHLAERVARIPVLLILGVIFFLLFPKALTEWRPHWDAVAIGVLAIAATFVLRFCVQYAFAMLAFWIERAHSVEQLWYLPYLFVSGLIAPLDDFPPVMREVLMWTPFPYLIYFPAKLLMGQTSGVPIGQGFGVMAIWTAVFWFIHRALWRAGLRHYSAMGA
jgi:ABC-2 type transport system permease protein